MTLIRRDVFSDEFRQALGNEAFNGGAGDQILFSTADRDKIDLTLGFAGTLSFIGAERFSGVAGQLRVVTKLTHRLQIDSDDNGVPTPASTS